MLTSHGPNNRRSSPSSKAQRGIVLLMALIVLVAMTLAALALTRSVYTSNVIAGNLAFQQAATHAADKGIETAIAWLEDNNGLIKSTTAADCADGGAVLGCDQSAQGYVAHKQDPGAGVSWGTFWTDVVETNHLSKTLPTSAGDNSGNTVSYVIQRMCTTAGDAQAVGNDCTTSPNPQLSSCTGGGSCDPNKQNLATVSQVYYRITVRVLGPRNTQSFVQSMVAL